MLYYSNGGPGPASRLLRVHAPGDGDHMTWRNAKGEKWTARTGWIRFDNAQLDIFALGEYFMVDASEVPVIQQQMRDRSAQFLASR